jgi:hypothetical protein
MVLYGAMEVYQPRPLWNTGLHTTIQGYILKYRAVYWKTGVDTGLAPLRPKDTKGATVWSNGNIPVASLLESRAHIAMELVYTVYSPLLALFIPSPAIKYCQL